MNGKPPYNGPGIQLRGSEVEFPDTIRVEPLPMKGCFVGEVMHPAQFPEIRVMLSRASQHPPEYAILRVTRLHPEEHDTAPVRVDQLAAVFTGVPSYFPVRHAGRERAVCAFGGVFLVLEEIKE